MKKIQNAGQIRPRFRKACLLSTSICLTPLLLLATPTKIFAGEANGGKIAAATLEEVVVTARKRQESLQDTPLSISAFTGKNMEARGVMDISQIADFTPNMQFDFSAPITGSSNAASIYIRGVGQSDFLLTTEPGVGVYVDGVYLSRSMGGVLDLLDIERIEVLRGPQGTLFGKNTIGGAINVTTQKPAESLEGSLEGTIGRFSRKDIKASINVPVVANKLFVRVSGAYQSRDGWAKRADDKELGDKNTGTIRGSALLRATENLEVILSADWTKARESSPVSTLLRVDPTVGLTGLYNGFVASGPAQVYDPRYVVGEPTVGGVVNNGTDPIGSNLEIYGGSLTLNWKSDDIAVKSISAYRKMNVDFGNDADHSPLPIMSTYNIIGHKQFSQEINVSGQALDNKLTWLVGGYFFNEKGSNATQVPITLGLFQNAGLQAFALGLPAGPMQSQLLALVAAGPSAAGTNSVNNSSYAAFTQATYHATDALSITAGVRYTYEKKKSLNLSVYKDLVDSLPPNTPIPAPFYVLADGHAEATFKDASPMVSLQYRFNPEVMTYMSFSRGFKSGGFNERYRMPRPAPVSFRPEHVSAFEAGFKTDLLDRRLRLNGSAFYSKYTDIQVTTVQNLEPLTNNAAKANIKGFELEFVALPFKGFTLNGGMGYIDANYTSIGQGVIVGINNMFVNTPEFSANIAAEYKIPVRANDEITLRGDYSYRTKVANDAENTPELIQSGYGLVNAGISYDLHDLGLSATLFGRNLTDKRYLVTGWADLTSLGLVEGVWGSPREWGLQVKYQF
jgi:iron complex outermembrane receptor protein